MERSPSRRAEVGGLEVRRALPQRARRTIGAWCFVDHFGPTAPDDGYRMTVGPHPHIGLSTVTWLLDGEGLHTDSLGSEQPIRPGQLNLMTAGSGIAHAEETPLGREGRMHGIQFWVAQPESTRHGQAAFEHHGDLPTVDSGPLTASVMVGSFGGERSPARADTAMVGLDISLAAGEVEVPLDIEFEHGVVALDGPVQLDGELVEADTLAYLDTGRTSLRLGARTPTRLLLIGGEPFESPVLMWWNFVARTTDEIDLATTEWNDGSDRFGVVDSGLGRLRAPETPWRSE